MKEKFKPTTPYERLQWALEVIAHLVGLGKPFSALDVSETMREIHPGMDIPHAEQRGLTWAIFHGNGNMAPNPGAELYNGTDKTNLEGVVYHEFTQRPLPLHPLVERFFKLISQSSVFEGQDRDDSNGFAAVPTNVIAKWAMHNGLKEDDKATFKKDLTTGVTARGGSFLTNADGRKFVSVPLYDTFLDDIDEEDFFDDDDDDDDESF